jgi:hypothetical protein
VKFLARLFAAKILNIRIQFFRTADQRICRRRDVAEFTLRQWRGATFRDSKKGLAE